MEQELTNLIKKVKISSSDKIVLNNPKPNKEIILREYQINHVNRLMDIIETNPFYMDFSDTRSGKTICTCHIALQYNLPILIICDKTIKNVWMDHFNEYGIPNYGIVTYNSLTSKKGYQPKHGLLHRKDSVIVSDGGKKEDQVEFIPSSKLLEIIDSGVLLIIDESQAIKRRDSQRYDACGVIIKEIIKTGKNSRFGMLSATPFDKEDQVLTFIKLVGLIKSKMLYIDAVARGGKFELKGLKELIDNCMIINPLGLKEFLNRNMMITRATKSRAGHFCVILFNKVIKPKFSSSMSGVELTRDIKNGFYILGPDEEFIIKEGINEIKNLMEKDKFGNMKPKFGSLPLIVKTLETIEFLKADIFITEARRFLSLNPTGKVLISYNYNLLFKKLLSEMADLGCMVLNGSTPDNKRNMVINEFRNNPKIHLMLGYRTVINKGISLCPNDQTIPLLMLISPSYHLVDIYQVAARFSDPNSKNIPTIRIVYCAAIQEEDRVYHNLNDKGEFLTNFLGQENKIFPNEYGHEDIELKFKS